jgi:hypothetical protein
MCSKQEDRRKRIYEFYLKNRSQGKKFTVNHFQAEDVPKRTMYDIIQRAENDSGHERVVGSGRVAKKINKNRIRRLKKMFDHHDGVSVRQAARKFGCDHSYIVKTLAKKTEIRVRKKKKIPLRTDDQRERIRLCCDRLYRKLAGKSCIIDDESYFTLKHSTMNGNNNFYSSDVKETPANVKYRKVAKYEPKLLVWLCISDKGISKPFFVPSGLAVNQKVYLEQCIIKRLVPFIETHHADGQYLFWPDLATSHWANSVIDYFEEKGINYVTKDDNPPNVPERRPVEDFWAILKGLVYEKNWQATDLENLRTRILKCLKEIDIELVKDIFRSTRQRVGKIRKKGVIEEN